MQTNSCFQCTVSFCLTWIYSLNPKLSPLKYNDDIYVLHKNALFLCKSKYRIHPIKNPHKYYVTTFTPEFPLSSYPACPLILPALLQCPSPHLASQPTLPTSPTQWTAFPWFPKPMMMPILFSHYSTVASPQSHHSAKAVCVAIYWETPLDTSNILPTPP